MSKHSNSDSVSLGSNPSPPANHFPSAPTNSDPITDREAFAVPFAKRDFCAQSVAQIWA